MAGLLTFGLGPPVVAPQVVQSITATVRTTTRAVTCSVRVTSIQVTCVVERIR